MFEREFCDVCVCFSHLSHAAANTFDPVIFCESFQFIVYAYANESHLIGPANALNSRNQMQTLSNTTFFIHRQIVIRIRLVAHIIIIIVLFFFSSFSAIEADWVMTKILDFGLLSVQYTDVDLKRRKEKIK